MSDPITRDEFAQHLAILREDAAQRHRETQGMLREVRDAVRTQNGRIAKTETIVAALEERTTLAAQTGRDTTARIGIGLTAFGVLVAYIKGLIHP